MRVFCAQYAGVKLQLLAGALYLKRRKSYLQSFTATWPGFSLGMAVRDKASQYLYRLVYKYLRSLKSSPSGLLSVRKMRTRH